MPYLDAVVKESWRWHPIVGSVPRRSLRTHDLEGYTVPKVGLPPLLLLLLLLPLLLPLLLLPLHATHAASAAINCALAAAEASSQPLPSNGCAWPVKNVSNTFTPNLIFNRCCHCRCCHSCC